MMLTKKELFRQRAIESSDVLCCPLCSCGLTVGDAALRCEKGHTWNINRKGYVNFLSRPIRSCYDQALFDARSRVFASGCYDSVLEAVLSLLPDDKGTKNCLDAGCGDGWYIDRIADRLPEWKGFGIDISRDAIEKAAGRVSPVLWTVGDLRVPPFCAGAFDAVLDILTPASYETFLRLLKPEGRLIKVYPGHEYLKEIRIARGLPLYEAGKVNAYMQDKVHVIDSIHVHKTYPVTDALWADFIRMTPLDQDLTEAELVELAARNPGMMTIDLHVTSACGK